MIVTKFHVESAFMRLYFAQLLRRGFLFSVLAVSHHLLSKRTYSRTQRGTTVKIRKVFIASVSALGTLVLNGNVLAQEDEPPNIVSVEIFGCNYNDGNDMGDLMEVVEQFNEWADENGVTDYEAQVLTPFMYSPAFPYDVVWLGVSPGFQEMGAGSAAWLATGQAVNAEFADVMNCSTHGVFAGTAPHVPAQPGDPDDGMVNLLSFQDCSMVNESTGLEAIEAHSEWGDYLAENGSDNFIGMIFPIAGENPAAEYNYKAVMAFDSAEAWGNYLETVIPAGLQTMEETFGRVTECDTARVYTSVRVRESVS